MKIGCLVVLALVPGCYSAEASIGREGSIGGGTAGGVAMSILAATYRETGTQNIAVGADMQILQEGIDGLEGTLGAGVRFAQQLGDSRMWRGFSRVSFGVDHCRLLGCKPDMQVPHEDAFEIQVGVEHMLMVSHAEKPRDLATISAELGVVFTHASDEALGTGNFIGLAIGLHVQMNALASASAARGAR